jgi:hypothetical protein
MRFVRPHANTDRRISIFRIVLSPRFYTCCPFGRGQRFLNRGGCVNQAVGGWQLSTITTLQSGSPVNTSSGDSSGTDFISNATRLNCKSGVKSRAGLGNEMFNAPNHVELNAGGQLTWANGSNPAPSANFGRMTSTFNRMRQIQFALKFTF